MLARLRAAAPLRPRIRCRPLSTQLHTLLSLDMQCDPEAVREAYLAEVKRSHPDAASSDDDGSTERFLTVQRAWETYRQQSSRLQAREVHTRESSALEMVMLIITCKGNIPAGVSMLSMRTATAMTIAQELSGTAFPPADVRRVELRPSVHGEQRLQVHVGADDPRHREALVARWGPRGRGSTTQAFVERLEANIVAAGGPSMSLDLKDCLPYSSVRPPPPTVV